MCGRFVVTESSQDLIELFDIDQAAAELPGPSYNVRPTDQVPVILESAKSEPVVRRLESARWSLVPSFAKELASKYPTFNARSEEVASKATFAASVVSRRAIIPATGYYEWHTEGTQKTPYFIHSASDVPIAFAGLYSWWKDESLPPEDPARWVLSATILTRDAIGELAGLHPRTPVMLPPEFWDTWLDPHEPGDQSFVDAAVDASTDMFDDLVFHEVGPVKDDGPQLIEPVAG
ncbi:SOS response-associated peptidase [Plantibacter sp. Mn2098]|uniref:SOS response-associated peptidase n=1 Tax=Plantibacter sp. Mn2098 TaxID=3395266 RepID=UPI003BBEF6BC